MATIIWYLQGTSPTTIEATDIIQFAGGTFGAAISVNAYNSSTHVESSVGADDSSANTPKNNKFISQAGGTGGDSQVDIGAGTVDLDAVTTANCVLKINFSHGVTVVTADAKLWAFDNDDEAVAPTDIDVRLAEQGDANWTEAEGLAAALGLTDQSTNTSHDFFVLMSVSPLSVGAKTDFAYKFSLTYQ